MRRLAHLGLLLALTAGLTLLAGDARAQTQADQDRARSLFEQGMSAAREGRHADAVEAFEESHRIYPHPGTLTNLALYQENEGRLVEAYRSVSELLDRFGTIISDEAREAARLQRERLERQLAILEVHTVPEGARLSLDGEPIGDAPLADPYPLLPGSYRLTAELEGYQPAESALDLEAGVRERLELPLTEEPPSAEDLPPSEPPVRRRRSFWRSPWPWVIGVVIAGGIVAATSPAWGTDLDIERSYE